MNQNLLNMVAPMPQFNQPVQGMNPMAMAKMLRQMQGQQMPLQTMQYPQMMGVAGMGNAMGTGIIPPNINYLNMGR